MRKLVFYVQFTYTQHNQIYQNRICASIKDYRSHFLTYEEAVQAIMDFERPASWDEAEWIIEKVWIDEA